MESQRDLIIIRRQRVRETFIHSFSVILNACNHCGAVNDAIHIWETEIKNEMIKLSIRFWSTVLEGKYWQISALSIIAKDSNNNKMWHSIMHSAKIRIVKWIQLRTINQKTKRILEVVLSALQLETYNRHTHIFLYAWVWEFHVIFLYACVCACFSPFRCII